MTTGGKKDRKGCTKGKIEAIMKNNAVRTKVVLPVTVSTTISSAPVKKSLTSTQSITANHQQQSIVFVHNQLQSSGQGSRHEVVRVKDEHDDPYTFTGIIETFESIEYYKSGIDFKKILITNYLLFFHTPTYKKGICNH